jgi:hypothetical protein
VLNLRLIAAGKPEAKRSGAKRKTTKRKAV